MLPALPEKDDSSNRIDQVELAAELLREGYAVRLVARGHSMQPLIPDEAVLELKPARLSDLRRGDVVLTIANATYNSKVETETKIFLIHRIISLKTGPDGTLLVQTRGDASFQLDSEIVATTLNLPGKVTTVKANGRLHNYTTRRWRSLNAMLGWAAFNQNKRLPNQKLTSSQAKILQTIKRKFFSRVFYLLRRYANRF